MCWFESYADLRGIRVSAYTSVPHRHFPRDPQQCLGWSFSFYDFLQFLLIFTFTLGLTILQFLLLATFFSFWSAALTDPRQKIIAIREGGYALVKEYLIIYYHYIIIYFKAFPALNILEFSQSESICTVSALTLSPDIMSVMSSLWSRLDTCWVVAPAPLQKIFWGGLKTHSTDGR